MNAYVYTRWTEDEVQFLVDTYGSLRTREQAEQLHRDLPDVAAKRTRMLKAGVFEGIRRAYLPPWTAGEDEWLEDNYHKFSMRILVRRLQRSESAIQNRKKRLGIVRTDGFYTARAAGEIFGWDPKRVAAMVHEGYLQGRRAPYLQGKNYPWVFTEEGLEQFVRQYPWLVRLEKMQEHYLRSVVRQEWEANPWYNSHQAAQLMGVHPETIVRRLRDGEIPAFQRSPGQRWSFWWIRHKDLLACFRRHDTSAERSRMMRNIQPTRRQRSGLPIQVGLLWELVCQDCAERYTVLAGPKDRTPAVLELARQQHHCQVRTNGHTEIHSSELMEVATA